MTIIVQENEKSILSITRPDEQTGYDFLQSFFVIGEFLGYMRETLEDAIFEVAEEIGDNIDKVGKEELNSNTQSVAEDRKWVKGGL